MIVTTGMEAVLIIVWFEVFTVMLLMIQVFWER